MMDVAKLHCSFSIFPQILIGLNENEGSESLMRLLPDLFPNEDIFRPEMSSEQFDRAMDRIFDSSSTQVRDEDVSSGGVFLSSIHSYSWVIKMKKKIGDSTVPRKIHSL